MVVLCKNCDRSRPEIGLVDDDSRGSAETFRDRQVGGEEELHFAARVQVRCRLNTDVEQRRGTRRRSRGTDSQAERLRARRQARQQIQVRREGQCRLADLTRRVVTVNHTRWLEREFDAILRDAVRVIGRVVGEDQLVERRIERIRRRNLLVEIHLDLVARLLQRTTGQTSDRLSDHRLDLGPQVQTEFHAMKIEITTGRIERLSEGIPQCDLTVGYIVRGKHVHAVIIVQQSLREADENLVLIGYRVATDKPRSHPHVVGRVKHAVRSRANDVDRLVEISLCRVENLIDIKPQCQLRGSNVELGLAVEVQTVTVVRLDTHENGLSDRKQPTVLKLLQLHLALVQMLASLLKPNRAFIVMLVEFAA